MYQHVHSLEQTTLHSLEQTTVISICF